MVGAAWLMTSLTDSPHMVALVQGSVVLPIMLLSLVAGAFADNIDRRRMMLGAQCFMMTVSIGLSLMAWGDALTPWLLLAFTFLIGCGTAFNNPAWQASVGDMVPRSALPGAVAFNAMGFNIARSVGPAIGGAIVAAAGAAAAFATNAVSYLALIVVLLCWRPDVAPRALPPERITAAIATGLRYVAMSPRIRIILSRAFLFGLAASAVPSLMPLVAQERIAGSAFIYGVLLGSFGLGAIVGALSSARLRPRLGPENLVRLAATGVAIGAATCALSTTLLVTLPALVLAGAGWVLALSTFNVSVQMSVPRWVVARSLATYQMSAFGGMAAGSWLFGYIAERQDLTMALLLAAALQLAGSVLAGLVLPMPRMADLSLDLAPLNRWTEPGTAVPVTARSGPIVITIEYRVPGGNVNPFLAAMNERRRICRRDGAHRWALLRDLAEPDLWVERFRVATWQDYVRTSQRRTLADGQVGDRIRALLVKGHPPRVRRMLERDTNGHMPEDAATPTPREMAQPVTDPTGTA